ncbi:MAG: ABC transporter permease, partial [Mesorhizobium sp.]
MSISANETTAKVSLRGFLAKYSVLIAFAAIVIFFSVASPTFLTPANLFNVLVNNVVMLAIVALGLTIVISSGGIDLSVGVSVDMASMIFVMLLAAGYSGVVGVAGGLGAPLIVGILNAILITRLHISPFLA